MGKTRIDRGVFPAGNDQYHAERSVKESGVMAHVNRVASILLRTGKVSNEMDALRAGMYEVNRAKWLAEEGFQVNRQAREELRKVAEAKKLEQTSFTNRSA